MSIIHSLLGYNKYRKFNKMPPKVAQLSSAAMTLGWGDTSIAESLDANLQVVMRG